MSTEHREQAWAALAKHRDEIARLHMRDLFAGKPQEISDARVLWTIADGETIWLALPSPIVATR